tara:strand:- start:1749 stop:2486 length:738 start_codon:yes stop_codon:yes gene_type:complete
MKLLCVGDVHTNLGALKKLIDQMVGKVEAVLQVGDFELYQSKEAIKQEQKYLNLLNKKEDAIRLKSKLLNKTLEPFKIPVYYIKGNHDDFDNLDSEYLQYLNIHYIKQGDIIDINGIKIAGVGGIHSPIKNSFKSADLEGSDRKFYTLEDVNKVVKNALSNHVDILLTHQAASGIMPEKSKKRFKPYWDEGTKDFVKLLEMPKLRWYIHGHHHVNYTQKRDSITCVGLGNFNKNKESYFLIDTGD